MKSGPSRRAMQGLYDSERDLPSLAQRSIPHSFAKMSKMVAGNGVENLRLMHVHFETMVRSRWHPVLGAHAGDGLLAPRVKTSMVSSPVGSTTSMTRSNERMSAPSVWTPTRPIVSGLRPTLTCAFSTLVSLPARWAGTGKRIVSPHWR